jgi:hypothetical protein
VSVFRNSIVLGVSGPFTGSEEIIFPHPLFVYADEPEILKRVGDRKVEPFTRPGYLELRHFGVLYEASQIAVLAITAKIARLLGDDPYLREQYWQYVEVIHAIKENPGEPAEPPATTGWWVIILPSEEIMCLRGYLAESLLRKAICTLGHKRVLQNSVEFGSFAAHTATRLLRGYACKMPELKQLACQAYVVQGVAWRMLAALDPTKPLDLQPLMAQACDHFRGMPPELSVAISKGSLPELD